jgi:hypothetical protein
MSVGEGLVSFMGLARHFWPCGCPATTVQRNEAEACLTFRPREHSNHRHPNSPAGYDITVQRQGSPSQPNGRNPSRRPGQNAVIRRRHHLLLQLCSTSGLWGGRGTPATSYCDVVLHGLKDTTISYRTLH